MDDMRLLSDTRALAEALRKDMWAGAAGTRVDPKAPEAEQAALMWTLVSVLVAFFEDNGLVPERLMTQRRDTAEESPWDLFAYLDPCGAVADAVDQIVRAHPLTAKVFPSRWALLEGLRPGEETAERLLSYWGRDPADPVGTRSRVNLASENLDTSFLGALYQDISETSRRTHALLATPGFVCDLLLDRVLEPALDETDPLSLDGFRFLDPACGSGGFLLGAFHRILERVRDEVLPNGSAVTIALSCVHGADRSPIAVLVSRFRLAVAAIGELEAGGAEGLEAESSSLKVVEADSLLEGRGAPVLTHDTYQKRREETPSHWDGASVGADVLGHSSYDVVVTNPPYITVKDKDLSKAYRTAYRSARSGAFALTAPFIECAFDLARPRGRVGLLVSNSFAKRDFGKHLVEEFLPTVTVDDVIDTSGAYIPGHGTPTLLLTGRRLAPSAGSRTTVVNGLRGEPSPPEDPARGQVWLSLLERLAKVPSRDTWTVSRTLDQQELHTHPWRLSAPEEESVLEAMRSDRTLREQVRRIGYVASTGSDDIFSAAPDVMRRWDVEPRGTIDLVTGSEVRDWQVRSELQAFFPRYQDQRKERVDIDDLPRHRRRLWPYRLPLAQRSRISPETWYDWHQVSDNTDASPWTLIFPWVSTHPHFALNREPNAPLNSAPVIEFPASVTEDKLLGLLGVLNSSAACFWLKQFSNSKGHPRDDQLRSGDTWDLIYEFTSNRMAHLPLPPLVEVALPRELDELARNLVTLRAELPQGERPFCQERLTRMGREWDALLGRMVLLQEELDWRVYELYGLAPQGNLPSVSVDDMPRTMRVGERPFEILLARAMAKGQETSHWFDRHGVTPVTELPTHWSKEYRAVVQARLEAIRHSPLLQVLERPDFKHRWVTPRWEEVWRPALEEWLLTQCETKQLWYTLGPDGTEIPTVRTVSELADLLENVPAVAEAVDSHTSGTTLRRLLPDLLQDEHVPSAAALRYKTSGLRKHADWTRLWERQWRQEKPGSKGAQDSQGKSVFPAPPKFTSTDFLRPSYWANRGKFDIPDERFVSYGGSNSAALAPTSVLGWAGWDAHERAWALVELIEQNLAPPTAKAESMMPLLAALLEVLPWVSRTGAGIGPVQPSGDTAELQDRAEGYLWRLGLTTEDVMNWRPPAPRRGRPPKRT